ncbi:MAG: MerR family transcriptional regulator [Parafilimonas sp.]|nr:MerR family transcriptional regulator [Parafilimonas sp.]
MHNFTIRDFEYLSGIKAHTIRIWEKRYALLSPSRSDSNIRFYTIGDLQLIFEISLLNKHGFKISHLSKLTQEQRKALIEELKSPAAQQENLINELFIKMFKLDGNGFLKKLNSYLQRNNINETISGVIYPFLQKTELLWNENHFGKEYERLVSNIIRQKLVIGIEEQSFTPHQTRTVIMLSPEDDYYETDLLYAQYLLKKSSVNVIYLGANVPQKDAVHLTINKQPDFVYIQINNDNGNTTRLLDKISKQFEQFRVVITGRQLISYDKLVPKNIQLKTSVPEAVDFIKQQ